MPKGAEVANWLDVSVRRLQQLAQEGIVPRPINGEYEVVGCIKGYIRYLRQKAEGGGSLTLTDERTRLARLQADQMEIELEERRAALVSTEWVVECFGRIMETFRTRMLALPAKVAPVAYGCSSVAEVKAVIEEAIHTGLEALSYPDKPQLKAYVGRKKRTDKKN
jgi:hypothetical protein